MSPSAPGLSSDARKQLLYAVRRVLAPIVRLLIRIGIGYQEFADLARGVYLESATRDGIGPAFMPTRERIALMTGLTGQQIDYYFEKDEAVPRGRRSVARVISEVLHKWHTDSRYLGPYGIPIELEFDSPPDRSFQSLVAQVDPTVRAGLVLEDLIQARCVAHSGEKHFRAIARSFLLPESLTHHRVEYFGYTLAHLARTLEYNFDPANADNKRLERFVFADKGLPLELLPSFEEHARNRTVHFLSVIDDWLARCGEKGGAGPRVEAGVNVFLYVEPPLHPRALPDLVQRRRATDSTVTDRFPSR